jgi:heterodisulfide reductase subunit A2
MTRTVIIIGGGIAGMEAASTLARKGIEVVLIEKEDQLGGHLGQWDRLFPNRRKSDEVIHFIKNQMNDRISVHLNGVITDVQKLEGSFLVKLDGKEDLSADALLLATGFDLFDCRKKEEYGYGIYDNVMTSAEVEKIFRSGKTITTINGKKPAKVGIIHCVGSRDEKVGNIYCSKVCCITGVKQSIEIKEQLPDAEIFCFYMDLRMFDRHFEEMYLEAQQKWDIHFIRGRLSEAAENHDRSIVLKVEDTLAGLPLKLNVDLVILLAGIMPSPETKRLASMLGLITGDDGFLNPGDEHFLANATSVPGVFIAGAVKGPVSVQNTIADAQAAAVHIENFVNNLTTRE